MILDASLASPCHRVGPAVVASRTVPFSVYACPACGLRFAEAEALPRCGTCGYAPIGPDTDPCPRCGVRRIGEDTFALPEAVLGVAGAVTAASAAARDFEEPMARIEGLVGTG